MKHAELRKLCEEATPGPWTYDSRLHRKYYGSVVQSPEGSFEVWRFGGRPEPSEEQIAAWGNPPKEELDDLLCDSHYQTVSDLADIRFIAASREAIPELLHREMLWVTAFTAYQKALSEPYFDQDDESRQSNRQEVERCFDALKALAEGE